MDFEIAKANYLVSHPQGVFLYLLVFLLTVIALYCDNLNTDEKHKWPWQINILASILMAALMGTLMNGLIYGVIKLHPIDFVIIGLYFLFVISALTKMKWGEKDGF